MSAVFRGSKRRAASIFSRIWSVFRIEVQTQLMRSSVQIAWSRPWNGVSLRSCEQRHLRDHVLEDVSLGLVAEVMAGDLLHRDQADALLPAGVEGLVQRRVLVEPGVVLEHDRVDDSPLGRRLDDLGPVLVVRREADEPGLARLPERVGSLLELLALDHVDRVVELVLVSQPVDEEQVDVVGPRAASRWSSILSICDGVLGPCPW